MDKDTGKTIRQVIVDTIREPLIVMDRSLRVLYASRNFYETFELTPEETEGEQIYSLDNAQWDISGLRHLLTDVLEKHEKIESFDIDHIFPRIGRRVMMLNARRIIDGDDNIEAIILAIENITDNKALEINRLEQSRIAEDLTTLIDTANAPIFGIDADGNVNEWNQSAVDITGFSKEDVMGRDLVSEFITDDYKESVKKVLDEALKGKETSNYEFPLYTKSGAKVDVLLNSTTRRDAAGTVTGVVGVGQNITELNKARAFRELAELELRQANDNLELRVEERTSALLAEIAERKLLEVKLRQSQKMEAIGQLVGGIAHDFNNILGVIIGNIHLLKVQVMDDGGLHKRVVTIDGAAQRAAELVKQLLGFSRKQATNVAISKINIIIEGMNNLIKRSITPEIEVNVNLAENLWMTGINVGDFQDAIINLVLNARDAMPDGGRLTIKTSNSVLDAIYCSAHPHLIPGEYVLLSVKDTGAGISSDQQEKIYDPFYTTKMVGKGTGLGLSMVFGFVTRSNGHIKVESELGAGTTFHLYLPRTLERRQPESTNDQQLDFLSGGSETILVVDDEVGLLDLAKELLETLGYIVLTANDGKQALELLMGNSNIALLFSDVVMPGGMSGYELVKQAKGLYPNLKILMTSGHTAKAGDQAQQMHTLIKKPYELEDMARQVRLILDGESLAKNRGAEK